MNCYVFIWVPTSTDEWGFYNIGIEGIVELGNYSVNNPVFSYRPDGRLYIYPVSMIQSQYPATEWQNYRVYRYQFAATESIVSGFISELQGTIGDIDSSTDYKNSDDYYFCSTIASTNVFAHYTQNYNNCFRATAIWANKLGNSTLATLFSAANDSAYQSYLPYNYYARDTSYWTAVSSES